MSRVNMAMAFFGCVPGIFCFVWAFGRLPEKDALVWMAAAIVYLQIAERAIRRVDETEEKK